MPHLCVDAIMTSYHVQCVWRHCKQSCNAWACRVHVTNSFRQNLIFAGLTSLDIGTDSTVAITGSEDMTARISNIHTGRVLGTFSGDLAPPPQVHCNWKTGTLRDFNCNMVPSHSRPDMLTRCMDQLEAAHRAHRHQAVLMVLLIAAGGFVPGIAAVCIRHRLPLPQHPQAVQHSLTSVGIVHQALDNST